MGEMKTSIDFQSRMRGDRFSNNRTLAGCQIVGKGRREGGGGW